MCCLAVLKKYAAYTYLKKDSLNQENKHHAKNLHLLQDALEIQLMRQGFASGYDFATQILGQCIIYQKKRSFLLPKIEELKISNKNCKILHLLSGGKGAPTKKVGSETINLLRKHSLHDEFQKTSEELLDYFILTLKEGSLSSPDLREKFFSTIEKHRKVLQKSPYYPHKLHQIISLQKNYNKSWTYKTTGAGGEDALLFIGSEENLKSVFKTMEELGWKKINKNFKSKKLIIEKI